MPDDYKNLEDLFKQAADKAGGSPPPPPDWGSMSSMLKESALIKAGGGAAKVGLFKALGAKMVTKAVVAVAITGTVTTGAYLAVTEADDVRETIETNSMTTTEETPAAGFPEEENGTVDSKQAAPRTLEHRNNVPSATDQVNTQHNASNKVGAPFDSDHATESNGSSIVVTKHQMDLKTNAVIVTPHDQETNQHTPKTGDVLDAGIPGNASEQATASDESTPGTSMDDAPVHTITSMDEELAEQRTHGAAITPEHMTAAAMDPASDETTADDTQPDVALANESTDAPKTEPLSETTSVDMDADALETDVEAVNKSEALNAISSMREALDPVTKMPFLDRSGAPVKLEALPLEYTTEFIDPKEPKWMISPIFSLDLSRYNIDQIELQNLVGSDYNVVLEDNKLAFTGGVRGAYNVYPYLWIETGVLYARKSTISGSMTLIDSASNIQGVANYRLSGRYLEVPLALTVRDNNGSFGWYGKVGTHLVLNWKSQNSYFEYFDYEKEVVNKVSPSWGTINPAISFGGGIEYNINHRVHAFVEPSYRFTLMPVLNSKEFSDIPVNPKWSTLSVGFGVNYYIGNYEKKD